VGFVAFFLIVPPLFAVAILLLGPGKGDARGLEVRVEGLSSLGRWAWALLPMAVFVWVAEVVVILILSGGLTRSFGRVGDAVIAGVAVTRVRSHRCCLTSSVASPHIEAGGGRT